MKAYSKLALFTILFTLFFFSACNPVKHVKGDEGLTHLDGKKKVGIEFDYSQTSVGSFGTSEKEYLEKRIEEKNEEEEGSGDEWAEKWHKDKENSFHPKFLERMNEGLEELPVEVVDDDGMDYQLVVQIDRIEPGFYGGVVQKPGIVDSKMLFVENGDKESPKTILSLKNIESEGGSFDKSTTRRLTDVYEQSGKYYGKYIAKKLAE